MGEKSCIQLGASVVSDVYQRYMYIIYWVPGGKSRVCSTKLVISLELLRGRGFEDLARAGAIRHLDLEPYPARDA